MAEQRSPDPRSREHPKSAAGLPQSGAKTRLGKPKQKRTRLDPKEGFLLQESATGRKSRRRMGQHVTYWNKLGGRAAQQVGQPGYGCSVVQSWCDIGRSHRDQTRHQVAVIRAGRPWRAVILLRGRHLAVVMAALFRNRSMLLWTRPKGAQGRTADGKEPRGIKDRDDRQRRKTLAQPSRPQTNTNLLP